MFCYKDDVLSLNGFMFGDYVVLIYLIELEIKDKWITDLARYASCIDS